MRTGDFSLRTRLVFGTGAVQRIAELARELGATRALVVTDPGIVRAGHADRVAELLAEGGVAARRFDGVHENPTERDVEACRKALVEGGGSAGGAIDLLIGLGGGSSIDVAKGCAFVHAGGGRMRDYRGRGTARGALLPLLAIPTTAGTGSEVQSFALIGDDDSHQKMACGDAQAAPRVAILDPMLTVTQPPFVAACTALDTLAHAVETAVTRARTPFSQTFSREAFALVNGNLERMLERPDDLDARAALLRASAFAGVAIENSMLGAAHSMANPLTKHHGTAHGQAVGTALPHVVAFNAHDPDAAAAYAELARAAGVAARDADDADAVGLLVARLRRLLLAAGFDDRLRDVPATAVPALADEAAEQWTAQFNPRPVDRAAFAELFRQVVA